MNVIKKKDILEVIGVKIQQARKEKGYTQEYVAEKIEKSVDILRSIENGRSVGSVETLLNICNLLEITLDYIFSDLLEKKEEILDKELYENFRELDLKENAISAIAQKALDLGMGARGLRTIMEEVMLDAMYASPSEKNLEVVTIDENCVIKKTQPKFNYKQVQKSKNKNTQ